MKKRKTIRAPKHVRRAHARLVQARQGAPRLFRLRGRKHPDSDRVHWGDDKFSASAWRSGETWRWCWVSGIVQREGEAPALAGCVASIKLTVESVQKNLAATLATIARVARK